MPKAPAKRYWVCQFTGWTFYLLLGLFMSYLFFRKHPGMYAVQFVGTGIFLGFTHLQRHLNHRYNWTTWPLARLILVLLVYNAIASVFCQLVVSGIMIQMAVFRAQEFSYAYLLIYSLNGLVILTFWSAIYFAFQFIQRWKEKEVETWKLQLSLKEAELEAIRSQLNPHFLFNSLNNIRSLVLEDPGKAREMITRLSAMMRYVIGYNRRHLVRVSEELEFLEHYVALEKIHFEDKLIFSTRIDPAVETAAIPPLGIQLLVENAIKHGIGRRVQGGKIELLLSRQNGHLLVQVQNTGTLDATTGPAGIGLQRLLERVAHSFETPATFNLKQLEENQVSATLTLPWQEYEDLYR